MSDYKLPPFVPMRWHSSMLSLIDIHGRANRLIYEALRVPVEEFGDPESSNLSTIKAAHEYHEREMATRQHKYFTRIEPFFASLLRQETLSLTELFLMQCKRKYSRKIYHNIERRIRREEARFFKMEGKSLALSIQRQLEDIMVRGSNDHDTRQR